MPAQPLSAADDSTAARPDDNKSFTLKGLQGAPRGLAAYAVLACYLGFRRQERSRSEDSFLDLPP